MYTWHNDSYLVILETCRGSGKSVLGMKYMFLSLLNVRDDHFRSDIYVTSYTRRPHGNSRRSPCKASVSSAICKQVSQQTPVMRPSVDFHENPISASCVVSGLQTDGRTD